MLRIISHIEVLLREHDCVIVPGVGGFVSHIVPAMCDSKTHRFIPIHKEIGFNASLQYNDGLLAESYMKEYGVGFNEALKMIEQEVLALNAHLHTHSMVDLGAIGKLLLSEAGQLVFERNDSFILLPESYGLPVFQVRTLQELQREEIALLTHAKQENDTIYIPIRKKVLHGIAATAAAVALFFIISTPVKDVDRSAYSASLFPVEVMPFVSSVEESHSIEEAQLHSEIIEEAVLVTKEEMPVKPEPVATNKKMFHIIIGSFVTDKQADEFIEKVDRSVCPDIGRVVRDERIRVYARKFDNRQDAETFLETLRKHPRYEDAWLFISR